MTNSIKKDLSENIPGEVDQVKSLLDRHTIQTLLDAGHTKEEVAEFLGLGVRTVRRIGQEPPIKDIDDKMEIMKRKIGRPSKTEPYRKLVEDLLEINPDFQSLELLRRARNIGYDGGKTAFFEFVKPLRKKKQAYVMRFEGLPGEFSQHDFGEVDVEFIDGKSKRVHFFASRLKCSRWAEVNIVPDEQVENLVRTIAQHFVSFGGLPLLAVFDRPKTIALEWDKAGKVTKWNPAFASAMFEMGVSVDVELCWPHRPNQKGSIERIVKWVKNSFFRQRRFIDEDDMQRQLSDWLREVNECRRSDATHEIPAVRLSEELNWLRSVKVQPEDLALKYPIVVGPTAMVRFNNRLYSMPPEAACFAGTIFVYKDKIRIVAGIHEANHPRVPPTGNISTLPEHRSARLAAVSGKRGRRYLKRQDLLETGDAASIFITELVHADRNWVNDIDRLHDLLQRYGSPAMDTAFREAVQSKVFSVEIVEWYLDRHHQMALEVCS